LAISKEYREDLNLLRLQREAHTFLLFQLLQLQYLDIMHRQLPLHDFYKKT
jgi:hypothetical protein